MFINGHTKEELQSLGAQMGEGLGDHAEYHQPRQLCEQIHSGKLKMKQSEGNASPVKQHPGYHRAAKFATELEQEQRISGGGLEQEEQAHPSSSSSSPWDGWWTSSCVEDKSWQWKDEFHDGF